MNANTPLELSIITVSYNTSPLLIQCLKSVFSSIESSKLNSKVEVIVVDNASRDDSVLKVKKLFPTVNLIQNKDNVGFAKANNAGILISKGKFILLLNSDTKVAQDSFVNLINEAKAGQNLGALGCMLRNSNGSIQPSSGFFPHLNKIFFWMSFIDDIAILSRIIKPYHVEERSFYKKRQKVDWVSGACFLLSREAIDKVGMLDEKIFMYGEEVEWCYRIKKAGLSVLYTPNFRIYHYKGSSATRRYQPGIIEEFTSLIYFYLKHKPSWQLPILKFFLMWGSLLRFILFGIIAGRTDLKATYAKALAMVR